LEYFSLERIEQVHAGVIDCPDAALALRDIPLVAFQEIQAVLHLSQNLRRFQHLDPGGSQLDAQRHTL